MDSIKVLMVDDESRMRTLVKDFLTREGYMVLEAGDGEQALDIFMNDKNISLVILDVMMPKMDGWETLKEIRKFSQVPVIMLTAKADERDELHGDAQLPLLQALAHADNGVQPGLQSGQNLLVDGEIRFAEILAALGMADDDVLDAQVLQHVGGDLAGVGALLLKIHVLGAHGDPQVLGQGSDGGQRLSGGELPGNDLGFDLGVDEYITKPFSPKILVARVAAILRRTTDAASDEKLVAGGIEMNLSAHVVTIDGKPVELSFKEFELLQYFITNKGVALSREKILNNVWNYDYFGDARTIDTHVKKLRSKMGDKGEYIKTIWGMGYKFEVE